MMVGQVRALYRRLQESRRLTVGLVYMSLLLDNTLLTMVVPIIPDYLSRLENGKSMSRDVWPDVNHTLKINDSWLRLVPASMSLGLHDVTDENDEVGTLLASKAFFQLLANGVVGTIAGRFGYSTPLLIGSIVISVSALMFALGESYALLLAARSVQGLGSACVAVAGMAIVAERYTDDASRSQAMGVALGGSALGVLVGYPFGSTLYDFVGKAVPFLIVASLSFSLAVLQAVILRPSCKKQVVTEAPKLMKMILNPYILLTVGAVWVSTTAIAVLEPCLPLWLMRVLQPSPWQLGTVFIPDSLGYLLGTNFFAPVALRFGRWLTAALALALVGVCSITIPFSTHILHLLVPHFGLGLGIGITDAALMPLLAHLVDRHLPSGGHSYGGVYALVQTAVCLAYSFGPLVGGHLVESLGFPWVMRIVGIANLLYSPLCLLLRNNANEETQALVQSPYESVKKQPIQGRSDYSRFHDEIEAD